MTRLICIAASVQDDERNPSGCATNFLEDFSIYYFAGIGMFGNAEALTKAEIVKKGESRLGIQDFIHLMRLDREFEDLKKAVVFFSVSY